MKDLVRVIFTETVFRLRKNCKLSTINDFCTELYGSETNVEDAST